MYYATDPSVIAERPESQRQSASPLSLHASSFFKDFAWSKEEKEAIRRAQIRDMGENYVTTTAEGQGQQQNKEEREKEKEKEDEEGTKKEATMTFQG